MDVIRRFLASGRPGIYFKVLKEGQVQTDDKIEIISRDKNNVTVKDIVQLYISRDHIVDNIETMRRAIKISALPEGWKYEFQQNIEKLEGKS
jgi:MOSC domain-containing protein YiiM